MPAFILRVPDHLGDGVMAIPAVAAIAALDAVTIVGPPWAERLYGRTPGPSVRRMSTDEHTPQTAVLFKPSISAAWAHRATPRRVGVGGCWRGMLLTDVVTAPEGHRAATYAALATHVGGSASASALPPTFRPTKAEVKAAPELGREDILLLPLSKSQATVGWPHFRALADALDGRAVFAAGPGECARLAVIAGPHRCLEPLPIGQFAAVAIAASAVVGNDSGLAHLAQAARRTAGLHPSSLHVIFGSTDPGHTGPAGCTAHTGPPTPCAPCYQKRCSLICTSPPCLEVPSATVLAAVR